MIDIRKICLEVHPILEILEISIVLLQIMV